jgi:tetratricopeptide (TPR) repeat protein
MFEFLRSQYGVRDWLTAIVTAICIAATAYAQSDGERIQRAIELTRAKQYAEASAQLKGLAEPEDAAQRIAFHRLKAAIASGSGEPALAVEEMRAALRVAPQDAGLKLATAVAETALADHEEKRGDFVNAAHAYQRAVELAPDQEQYRLNLALELVQHQTFEPAITVLEQAAPRFPKSVRIRTLLAVSYYAIARNEDAVRRLAEALQIDPAFDPARDYLSRIVLDSSAPPDSFAVESLCGRRDAICAAAELRRDREASGAFRQLQIAARMTPDNAVARCELGRVYEWREEWDRARTEMEACVRLDASSQNHYRLARIYNRLGLSELAQQQMAAQKETARRAGEEAERRQQAIQAFQYVIAK